MKRKAPLRPGSPESPSPIGLALLLAGTCLLLQLGTPAAIASDYSDANFVVKDYDALSLLETQADMARREFWRGHYREAAAILEKLCLEHHASTALYLCELGLCQAALGDYTAACHSFRDAAQISEFFTRSASEKKALSKFGREAEKVYRGDPYERACAHLALALFLMDVGDYDNALAACKNGLLADSDAVENRYDSDFTMLHLLEARCQLLRGNPDAAAASFKSGEQSYRITHSQVRQLYAQRQEWLEALKLSKKERKNLKYPQDEKDVQARLLQLDEMLEEEAQKIDTQQELGDLLTGRYNTLLILSSGKAPTKRRTGVEGNVVVFDLSQTRSGFAEVVLDGKPLPSTGATNLADVEFQATTRGGRAMDKILQGKVAFKTTAVTVGRSLTEAGAQAGGLGGLAVALVGAAIQGVGGAVTPEADTRCWKTLPAGYLISPLRLEPGEHAAAFTQNIYFEKVGILTRQFKIGGPGDFKVLFAPPAMAARYSASAQFDRSSAKKRPASTQNQTPPTNGVVLLPPVLGFDQIEKFPSDDQKKRPRAFVPDVALAGQRLQQTLDRAGFTPVTLEHIDALQKNPDALSRSRAALQCELLSLDWKTDGKTETLGAQFEFALIDSANGQRLLDRRLGPTCKRSGKFECTEAFYTLFETAAASLFQDTEFVKALKHLATAQPAVPKSDLQPTPEPPVTPTVQTTSQ